MLSFRRTPRPRPRPDGLDRQAAATSTMVATAESGRTLLVRAPDLACEVISVTYRRVRTTCSGAAPAAWSASSAILKAASVWRYGSPGCITPCKRSPSSSCDGPITGDDHARVAVLGLPGASPANLVINTAILSATMTAMSTEMTSRSLLVKITCGAEAAERRTRRGRSRRWASLPEPRYRSG